MPPKARIDRGQVRFTQEYLDGVRSFVEESRNTKNIRDATTAERSSAVKALLVMFRQIATDAGTLRWKTSSDRLSVSVDGMNEISMPYDGTVVVNGVSSCAAAAFMKFHVPVYPEHGPVRHSAYAMIQGGHVDSVLYKFYDAIVELGSIQTVDALNALHQICIEWGENIPSPFNALNAPAASFVWGGTLGLHGVAMSWWEMDIDPRDPIVSIGSTEQSLRQLQRNFEQSGAQTRARAQDQNTIQQMQEEIDLLKQNEEQTMINHRANTLQQLEQQKEMLKKQQQEVTQVQQAESLRQLQEVQRKSDLQHGQREEYEQQQSHQINELGRQLAESVASESDARRSSGSGRTDAANEIARLRLHQQQKDAALQQERNATLQQHRTAIAQCEADSTTQNKQIRVIVDEKKRLQLGLIAAEEEVANLNNQVEYLTQFNAERASKMQDENKKLSAQLAGSRGAVEVITAEREELRDMMKTRGEKKNPLSARKEHAGRTKHSKTKTVMKKLQREGEGTPVMARVEVEVEELPVPVIPPLALPPPPRREEFQVETGLPPLEIPNIPIMPNEQLQRTLARAQAKAEQRELAEGTTKRDREEDVDDSVMADWIDDQFETLERRKNNRKFLMHVMHNPDPVSDSVASNFRRLNLTMIENPQEVTAKQLQNLAMFIYMLLRDFNEGPPTAANTEHRRIHIKNFLKENRAGVALAGWIIGQWNIFLEREQR